MRPSSCLAGSLRSRGMRDHPQLRPRHAELLERCAAALAVGHHPVEAGEETLPRARSARSATGKEIVGGEDERAAGVEEQRVRLRRRDPLQVEHVAVGEPEPGKRDRMLESLHGEAAVPRVHPRRKPVEAFVDLEALCLGHRAVAKRRREETNVDAQPGERAREGVVVRRRVRRGVGEHDAHRRQRRVGEAPPARASRPSLALRPRIGVAADQHGSRSAAGISTATPAAVAPRAPAADGRARRRDRPAVLCLQEVPVVGARARSRGWSGLRSHWRSSRGRRAVPPASQRGSLDSIRASSGRASRDRRTRSSSLRASRARVSAACR